VQVRWVGRRAAHASANRLSNLMARFNARSAPTKSPEMLHHNTIWARYIQQQQQKEAAAAPIADNDVPKLLKYFGDSGSTCVALR
jgi:hypothetical protein